MEMSDVVPALRERLGVEASTGLLALFTVARQEWTAEMTSAAVERFERRLSEELLEVRRELHDGLAGLRQEFRQELRTEIGGLRTEIGSLREEFRAELRTEISGVREELRTEISGVRGELRTGIGGVRGELREIHQDITKFHQEQLSSRFGLVKWCFVFWVGQALAVAGIIGVMLRFVRP